MTPLERRMAELSASFRKRSIEEREALSSALVQGDRATIRDRAHKLAGVAGMFGHPEVGEAALELEDAAEAGDDLAAPLQRLDALLAALTD